MHIYSLFKKIFTSSSEITLEQLLKTWKAQKTQQKNEFLKKNLTYAEIRSFQIVGSDSVP